MSAVVASAKAWLLLYAGRFVLLLPNPMIVAVIRIVRVVATIFGASAATRASLREATAVFAENPTGAQTVRRLFHEGSAVRLRLLLRGRFRT